MERKFGEVLNCFDVKENEGKITLTRKEESSISTKMFQDIFRFLNKKKSFVSSDGYLSVPIEIKYRNKDGNLKIGRYHLQNGSLTVRIKMWDSENNIYAIHAGKNSSYPLIYAYGDIESISYKYYDEKLENEKKLKMIHRARYDENTWSNLNNIDSIKYIEGKKIVSIKNHFSYNQMCMIKKAFDEKKQIIIKNESDSPRGRDYSVETKMGEDGIFRAWYSSEYTGCLNGDYYYLLAPNKAIFVETD